MAVKNHQPLIPEALLEKMRHYKYDETRSGRKPKITSNSTYVTNDNHSQLKMMFTVVRKYVSNSDVLFHKLRGINNDQLKQILDVMQAYRSQPEKAIRYLGTRFGVELKMRPREDSVNLSALKKLPHPPLYGSTVEEAMVPELRVQNMKQCTTERTRVAFPKLHKVAGDTIKGMLHRFGYERNLTFLLPKPFLSSCTYPWNLYPGTNYPPSKTKSFDILTYHTVYDSKKFGEIMPKDTVYLAILREPFSHFKSVWHFYGLSSEFGIMSKGTEGITTFLQDPERYDTKFYVENKSCRGKIQPVSLTRNPLSVDLGLPLELATIYRQNDSEKNKVADMFIQKIESEFPLVMIMEHFDESLVLFKRLMCWSHKDIIYKRRNSGKYLYKRDDVPEYLREVHKQWSHVDYALYEHFYKVFRDKLQEGGQDLAEEIEHFKKIQLRVSYFCDQLSHGACDVGHRLVIEASKWDKEFHVDKDFCLRFERELKCEYVIAAERQARVEHWPVHYNKYKDTFIENESRATIQKNCLFCERTQYGMCLSVDYLNYLAADGIISKEKLRELRTRYYPKSYNLHCKAK
ncbi:PREDICTED: galactosylceramide sulfotransferase-like [Branchiostoma belcheri]|uniref:Galactosylceramide sulfotransferase-like n=1 Tax=Branchiostoma belcheri TaxID=7741 RepID=A0A6P4ZZF2_BRABE|nr:PREDICTED: galactosylceramide sulfotransferase-like [Branchiostoma belcheri]